MHRRTVGLLMVGVSCAVIAGEPAHALTQVTEKQELKTLTGEIVDPALYLREGRRGPDAQEATNEAVDGGQTLSLLEDQTDTLYILLAEEPGEDPNELVYEYLNQRVKVTGYVYKRSGVQGLVVTAVEPLGSSENTEGESPQTQDTLKPANNTRPANSNP